MGPCTAFRGDQAWWTELRNAVTARIRAVAIVGEKAWPAPRRQPPDDAAAQLQRRLQQRSRQRKRLRKPERGNHRLVQHRVDAVTNDRCKEPRKPRREQVARVRADALV